MPMFTKKAAWPVFLILTALLGGLLWPAPIDAAEGGRRYATSKSPYWQVGALNRDLSSFCRKHLFNQIKVLNLNIGYFGDKGKGVTGIAKQGWNLYDPLNLAIPELTYHFRNDGYSNCRVYTATRNPNLP